MKLAVLETGAPPPELQPRFGRYPAMFERLLGAGSVEASYDVTKGNLPANPLDHQAYLITGSAAGVYEPLPWIEAVRHFLQAAKGKARLVGVCFGHQLMAEAFGGRVTRSDKGWAVGLRTYEVIERAPWMDDASSISVPVSHRDQVVDQPPASRLLVGCEYASMAVLAYDDQPAISFQCHPEFEPEFAAAMIELRQNSLANADAAIASLTERNDNRRVAEWIKRFCS